MVSFNFERFAGNAKETSVESSVGKMPLEADNRALDAIEKQNEKRLRLEQGHMMRLLGEADADGPGVVSSREANELRDMARLLADADMENQKTDDSREMVQ